MPKADEQPYYYPSIHNDNNPDPMGRSSRHPDWRFRRTVFAFATLLLIGAIVLLTVAIFTRIGTPPVSAVDVSATAEAVTFATAQADRSATRVSENATSTAGAEITAVALTQASATAEAYAHKTATAAAVATAQAPPTLTAEAQDFEAEQASAEATAQAMDKAATQVYGPVSGTLDHGSGKYQVCLSTGLQLHNFIAQAAFYNPYPVAQHPWDYGFSFTNIGADDQYNVSVSSDTHWATTLKAPGYYIRVQDTTTLLSLEDLGFNFLKIYVSNDDIHLFINGQFAATAPFSNFNLGGKTSDRHEPQSCTGLQDGDLLNGGSTRYQDFTVWSAP
jgi:hypothetical protein